MTNDEWLAAVRLYAACWPQAKPSAETITAWSHTLRDQPGARVQQAVYDLAATHEYPPSVAAILKRCKDIARDEAMAAPPELVPFGSDPDDWRDRQWNALSDDEKRHWLQLARAQWPDWLPIKPDSPLLAAHAAALARGTIDPVVTP